MFKSPQQLVVELREEACDARNRRTQTGALLLSASSKIEQQQNAIRDIFDQIHAGHRRSAEEIEAVINRSSAPTVPALRHDLRRLADKFHELADRGESS